MKQITIIVNNEVGKLADISFILGKSKINIDAVSANIIEDTGIINLTLKDDKKAISVLEKNGYKCLESDIFILKIQNSPGEFAKITKLLSDKKISITSVSTITQTKDYSIYSLKVDNYSTAKKYLEPYIYTWN